MKLADIKIGDSVQTDDGFTCMKAAAHIVEGDEHGLFIQCNDGKHYLVGQENKPGEDLIGILPAGK